MTTKENPTNLIQLLASYRPAPFPGNGSDGQSLATVVVTVENNCAQTVRFTDRALRDIEQDCEEMFALCSARENALRLARLCRRATNHSSHHGCRKDIGTLRQQYGIFANTVKHMFFLLDRDLARRLDGVL